MRVLLTIMAIAMLTISVGCDKTETAPADKDAKTTAVAPDTSATQNVSLEVPGEECSSCAGSCCQGEK